MIRRWIISIFWLGSGDVFAGPKIKKPRAPLPEAPLALIMHSKSVVSDLLRKHRRSCIPKLILPVHGNFAAAVNGAGAPAGPVAGCPGYAAAHIEHGGA